MGRDESIAVTITMAIVYAATLFTFVYYVAELACEPEIEGAREYE